MMITGCSLYTMISRKTRPVGFVEENSNPPTLILTLSKWNSTPCNFFFFAFTKLSYVKWIIKKKKLNCYIIKVRLKNHAYIKWLNQIATMKNKQFFFFFFITFSLTWELEKRPTCIIKHGEDSSFTLIGTIRLVN